MKVVDSVIECNPIAIMAGPGMRSVIAQTPGDDNSFFIMWTDVRKDAFSDFSERPLPYETILEISDRNPAGSVVFLLPYEEMKSIRNWLREQKIKWNAYPVGKPINGMIQIRFGFDNLETATEFKLIWS